MREQAIAKLNEAIAAQQAGPVSPQPKAQQALTKEDEFVLAQLRSPKKQEHMAGLMGLDGLSPLGKEKAAEVVVERLKSATEQQERLTIVSFMQKLGPAAKGAVPTLVTMLEQGDMPTHMAVAITLGAIGPAAKEALPALEKAKSSSPMPMLFDSAISSIRGETGAGQSLDTGSPPVPLRRNGR
jgi:hypothetical protein